MLDGDNWLVLRKTNVTHWKIWQLYDVGGSLAVCVRVANGGTNFHNVA
jgi:hypothetical protein